jgi:hypothetical protein
MKQVIDKHGAVLEGIHREPNGAISIKNDFQLLKAELEIERINKMHNQVEDLQSEIRELKEMLKHMLKNK